MYKKILIFVPIFLILVLIVFLVISRKISIKSNFSDSKIMELKNPKLEILSSGVFLESAKDTKWINATDGQEIVTGTVIKTNNEGRAQIVYPSGTVTRLDNNSQITLKEYVAFPQQVDILVEAGTIWSRVAKLLGEKVIVLNQKIWLLLYAEQLMNIKY